LSSWRDPLHISVIQMKKILLTLLSLSIACSSYDLTTPTQDALTGKWDLAAVNDAPLPFTFSKIGTNKTEITQDVLTITAPNTFSEVTTARETQNGQVTMRTIFDSGTYEFNSYVVSLQFQSDGSIGSGTLAGRTMTIITSGVTFTYKKQ
jgi:hypothetical protein